MTEEISGIAKEMLNGNLAMYKARYGKEYTLKTMVVNGVWYHKVGDKWMKGEVYTRPIVQKDS